MMRGITLLLMCLALTSCAVLAPQKTANERTLDRLLEENRYDEALEYLATLDSDDPDYARLVQQAPDIEKAREAYIQKILIEAAQYEPTQDWVQAEKTIEDALAALPDAPELTSQLDHYESLRDRRLEADEASILVAKAYYLYQVRPYYESLLYNARNRFFAYQSFNDYLTEAKQVSRELYAIGLRYWQQEQLSQARQALLLSLRTAENRLSADLLAKIQEVEQAQRATARAQQQQASAEQVPQLKRTFSELMSFGDYQGAAQIVSELKTLDAESAKELEETLAVRRAQAVKALIASGNTLYNNGYLNEAINRWERALALDPNNPTLPQQIERAKTFLNNFKRWQGPSGSD